jgi:IclR family pca regulon transcriptional regulator
MLSCRVSAILDLALLGEGAYPVHGPNTITTLDLLLEELDRTRRRGYALTDEELAPGLRSVAAPIRDRDG